MKSFENKVVVVTGGAHGIGATIVNEFEKEGAKVAYIDIRENPCFVGDLSKKEVLEKFAQFVIEKYGHVDVLVNNAGIAEQCQIQDIREELWDRIFAVNVKGVLNTVQAVLPDMLHRKSGCIINTSSIWGMHGASCESVYSSSKHAVIGLTKSMAAELALSGIRVNCVAPGVIDTDMVKVLGDETLRDLADNTPIGRLGKPEDIAAAVSYLASDGASFVTGQVLTCDGGFIHL